LATGCGGGQPKDVATPTSTAQPTAAPTATTVAPPAEPDVPPIEAQKAYVKEGDAAWAAHDAKKVMALYATDAVITEPGPSGVAQKSAADMERQLGALFVAFPDAKLTTTRLVTLGPKAIAEWTFTGTHKADFMGAKATNKPVGYRGASVLVFNKKGKVQSERLYHDHATMMGQLGLLPKGQKVRPVEPAPTTPLELVTAKEGEGGANAELLKKLYEAAEKKDNKAYGALLAPDFLLSNSYDPTDAKKATVMQQMPQMNQAFPDPKWAVKECTTTADLAICEVEWTATWKAPAMGMKPTGKTGTVHALELAQMKDGKILRLTGYGSGAEFAFAFGIPMEPPQQAAAPKEPAKEPTPEKPKGG
jgi:steroid delta-isomerase-like uncharacterized protein